MTTTHSPKNRAHKMSRKRIIASASLFAAGLALFLTMYVSATTGGGAAMFDVPLHQWALMQRDPLLTVVMQTVTTVSSPVVLVLATIIGSGLWAWKRRDAWRPILFTATMATAYVLTSVIKELVERTRPAVADMVPPFELDFSFPSGHTIGAAMFVFALGYLMYAHYRSRAVLTWWSVAAAISIAAVAFSRIYLGYHWFTDVSASVGLALIILAGTVLADGLRHKYRLTKAVSDTGQ